MPYHIQHLTTTLRRLPSSSTLTGPQSDALQLPNGAACLCIIYRLYKDQISAGVFLQLSPEDVGMHRKCGPNQRSAGGYLQPSGDSRDLGALVNGSLRNFEWRKYISQSLTIIPRRRPLRCFIYHILRRQSNHRTVSSCLWTHQRHPNTASTSFCLRFQTASSCKHRHILNTRPPPAELPDIETTSVF